MVDAAQGYRLRDAVGERDWELFKLLDLGDVIVRFDAVDRGVLYVDGEYAVRGTNNPRNLVFPFYVIPPHEEVGA